MEIKLKEEERLGGDLPVRADDVALALNTWGASGVHNDALVCLEVIVENAVALIKILASEGLRGAEVLGPGEGHCQQASEDGLWWRIEL